MSVICQNFVQNAWKKDLCSNCFKSVGDHEGGGVANDPRQNESSNSISQSSYSTSSNGTAHTTWKSLISERNQKNSQPFKLENGFQGRLLTINKANSIEKKSSSEAVDKNGHTQNYRHNGTSTKVTFGQSRFSNTTNGFHSKTNSSKSLNGQSSFTMDDKIQLNGVKTMLNKIEGKSGKTQNSTPEGISIESTEAITADKEYAAQKPSTLTNEEKPQSPLQSILKKTTTTPETSNGQPRRNGNVGFKDEEPLVIGYGGRDFSPEELEWDMNSPDYDMENGSDSLDETEDDKAFSKITKQNTEFNSDNANLLRKQKPEVCVPDKTESTDKSEDVTQKRSLKASNSSSLLNPLTHIEGDAVKRNKNDIENEGAVEPSLDTGAQNEERSNFVKFYENGTDEAAENKLNDSHQTAKVEVKEWEMRNEKIMRSKDNDFVNVAIKSEEGDLVVTSRNDSAVVEETDTKTEDARTESKNNSELESEVTSPPSPPTVICSNIVGEDCGSSEYSAMLSDGEEAAAASGESGATETGENEWPDDNDGLAGQILQAINTSLTNRHKMNNEEDVKDENAIKRNLSYGAISSDGSLSENKFDSKQSTEDSITVSVCEITTATKENENVSEIAMNVEPRPSFLHGRVSNSNKPDKPSAIYGPASDLFVSRSNSSSSSSSDECSKPDQTHSINVIVNGQNTHRSLGRSASEDLVSVAPSPKQSMTDYETDSSINAKFKPRIPAKPSKRSSCSQAIQIDSGHYAKPPADIRPLHSDRRKSESSICENGSYYSEANSCHLGEGPKSVTLVDHYAESNIYHEVMLDRAESRSLDSDVTEKSVPKRETKLAALAIELEQVRHSNNNNNTKRQAPAPPKIPDPPLEDPPSSSGRISPDIDNPHGFSSFRGEAMAFSSSSSTASTSSQDTETGYASWNLHGDMDDKRKHSKSKSSFLLQQYSKCKMLAMGYADDSSKSRKKFSIKKLLKIRKDGADSNAAFDPSCPNPKAWKYSDHFERPRAKLEIIHPMDLENKSVTVNPGFDSLHSGSLSSFTASADDLSLRNSVSSDYGSFYSDAVSPTQDLKPESNYECIPTQLQDSEDQEDSDERLVTCNSNSPTPSRSSSVSQASTLTSEGSKNSTSAPSRPPKPPPPPRAHSLLPRNKPFPVDQNFPNSEDGTTKPQAPRRQCKSSAPKPDCGIYDNTGLVPSLSNIQQINNNLLNEDNSEIQEENHGIILDVKAEVPESIPKDNLPTSECDTQIAEEVPNETQISVLSVNAESSKINVTVKSTQPENSEKTTKSAVTRNKHPPVTKAPSRPPPIYMKPQLTIIAKNPNPWKTLEDTYLVLTASNRELLVKLVNQATKKRKSFLAKLHKMQFKWADFEIDLAQPSSIFAFGEKIAYHATMPQYPEYLITLVVTVQQSHNRLNESSELKYPVFGQFVDSIPHELLDSSGDAELESMQATILVMDRSNITTIECFTENLPNPLSEENEKELSFILLQLIHSLKSLQAQGIESIDSSFQNLILAKTKTDKYNTLIFLSDNCYDENDYISESSKISLCQYALMLLLQLLGIQSPEELVTLSENKFSSDAAKKTFEISIALLSEEKAVSLSQTKTLLECFLWDLTKVLEIIDYSDDLDGILQRWMDVKRSNFIKSIINDESLCDINVQSEFKSQFLVRTSIRNVKEILSYL